jgi:eukaryotic-like serine/threonine-protein kinase
MMSNEPRTIRINWTRLDGASLDGGFRLKQMIGADGVSATFRTMDGAVIKAYRASGEEAEGQLRLWQQARALQHPNLIRVLGSGKTELEGQEVIYVALESTDESVADALSERPLERNEATEIVRSVVNALEYLHSLGFVHGSLSPETVYALGETVKLSPEGIKASGTNAGTEMYKAKYPAPEWLESVTPAADVWSLGATLYEALTQEDATQREESGRTVLPAPFQEIVQGALKPDPATRITLPEVQELIDSKAEAIADEPPAPTATTAADISVPVAAEAAAPPAPAGYTTPVGDTYTTRRMAREETSASGVSKLIYGLIAVIVVAGLILVLRARSTGQHQQQAAAQQRKEAALPPQTPPAPGAVLETNKPSPTIPSHTVSPLKEEPSKAQPASKGAAGGNNIWRVVVYTYNSEADAKKKAADINARHPGVGAEVFSPKAGAPYLVVIGGQMTREQAVGLRQKARQMGLPRDSYVQNYSK